MDTDDYTNMIRWHPEMILVTMQPVTWRGFLNVCCDFNSGKNIRIKIKLTLPKYPSLHDAEINFGKEISFIPKEGFSQKVKELTRNVTKVSSFLTQLQSLIGSIINNANITQDNGYEALNDTAMEIIQELRDVLNIPSETQISANNTLNTIKLSLKNVSVKLQRSKFGAHQWTVVYSDLPDISAFAPFENNLTTLTIAKNKFKMYVEILEKSWLILKKIDENCWVIDPLQPKPSHLYRRIYLTPLLSMFVKIDTLNPIDLPEIKFMGSEIEVETKKELVSRNLHNWNPQHDFIDNLMMLLDIDTFPRKQEKECREDDNAIVADEECCICFSLESENETLPNKVCSNEKCKRHFHKQCLLQWLQAVAGNHIVFDHIHGSCPNCQESISCCIK